MKFIRTLILTSFLTSLANSVLADVNTAKEIDYLLTHISESQCTFVRNGKEHDAKSARSHIEKKYNYLKSRIDTAEEFIEYAATKSSFSGKPYQVKCGDQLLQTSNWLASSLQDYRSSR